MNLAAFDEYGEFEKNGNGTKYIAGIIYEGKEPDIRVERKRINSYLKLMYDDIDENKEKTESRKLCYKCFIVIKAFMLFLKMMGEVFYEWKS